MKAMFAAGAAVAVLALMGCGSGLGARAGGRTGRATATTAPAAAPTRVPSSSAAAAGGSAPAGAPSRWRLTFESHFSGSALSPHVWGTCYPWAAGASGCTNFSNHEFEWYQASQVRVSGGLLHLVAQQIPTAGKNAHGAPKTYACRSGMVTTYPGFRFQYGYVQVVARVPQSAGLWPALWLAAANLKWPPEIDMLEHWGVNGTTGLYLHPVAAKKILKHVSIPHLQDRWHTFGLLWTASSLVWSIDGKKLLVIRQHIPQQSMYFIANVAAYRSSGCDGSMIIRSVKVWQQS